MINFEEYHKKPIIYTDLAIIYPGRFQPAHKNHAKVYRDIQKRFPTALVYISTTNAVKADSPFDFKERKIMLEAAGVPADFIVQCNNPYVADEIKSKLDLNKTKIIFAVGEKDMQPPKPRFSIGLKKDGSPTYMQIPTISSIDNIDMNNISTLHTADKHAYVCIAPTQSFVLKIGTNNITIFGATQIRNLYRESSISTRESIIYQLYNTFDVNIFNIFNKKLT